MLRLVLSTLASLALLGCTSASKSNSPTASAPVVTPPESAARVPSIREAFPKEKAEQSQSLLNILRASGVPATINRSGQLVYRAYHVDCRTNEDGKRECSFERLPSCRNKDCRTKVKSANAEALADLLFGLPVAQGDSGAITPYIDCVTSVTDTKLASCSVAILLDYQGP